VRAGITTLLLPARNRRDYEDIPEEARRTARFVWCERIDDAVAEAIGQEAMAAAQ
jgi:ATP-dependent Lon protease